MATQHLVYSWMIMGQVFQIPNSELLLDLIFDSPYHEWPSINCRTYIYRSCCGPIGFDCEDEAEFIAVNFMAGGYIWWSESEKEPIELTGKADSISQIRRSSLPRGGIVIHTPDASLTSDLKHSKSLMMELKVNALRRKHHLPEKELDLPFIFRLFNAERKLVMTEFQRLFEHSDGVSIWQFNDHGRYFNLFEVTNKLENKLIKLCQNNGVPFSRIVDPKQVPYW